MPFPLRDRLIGVCYSLNLCAPAPFDDFSFSATRRKMALELLVLRFVVVRSYLACCGSRPHPYLSSSFYLSCSLSFLFHLFVRLISFFFRALLLVYCGRNYVCLQVTVSILFMPADVIDATVRIQLFSSFETHGSGILCVPFLDIFLFRDEGIQGRDSRGNVPPMR